MTSSSPAAQAPAVPPKGSKLFSYVVAATAALGGLLYGYDTGVISGALVFISEDFHLGSSMKEFVTSAILIGAVFGSLFGGRLADRLGRKKMVTAIAVVFGVGTLFATVAPNVEMLIAARFVLGLSIGGAAAIIPVYIAELAAPNVRGSMVTLFQLMCAVGQLVAYLVNYAFAGSGGWRWMFGIGLIPAVVLLIGMLFLPESPRWLIGRGRDGEATGVLRRLRSGDRAGTEVDAEVDEIKEVVSTEDTAGWRGLLAGNVRPALLVAVGIAVLCQITGINAVMYYAPTILTDVGFGNSAALLTSVGVGVVLVVMCLVGTRLVDRWGRRKLLLAFAPGTPITLGLLGWAFLAPDLSGGIKWLIVACLLGYIALNGGSLSVVVWLIGAEVFPRSVRSSAASVAAIALWLSDLLVSLTTLSLINTFGPSGTFWLYGAIGLVSWAFIYFIVPETKGRSLEEIEKSLGEGTFLHRSRKKETVGATEVPQ